MDRRIVGSVCITLLGSVIGVVGAFRGWEPLLLVRLVSIVAAGVVALSDDKPTGVTSGIGMVVGSEVLFGNVGG